MGVSARDDEGGLWKALFIGLVRRGGMGRGRFTNRPYGLFGRAERRVCAWIVCDVTIGLRTRGIRRPDRRGGS